MWQADFEKKHANEPIPPDTSLSPFHLRLAKDNFGPFGCVFWVFNGNRPYTEAFYTRQDTSQAYEGNISPENRVKPGPANKTVVSLLSILPTFIVDPTDIIIPTKMTHGHHSQTETLFGGFFQLDDPSVKVVV